jgi:tRNA(fMet)-specific endonuclease VapC
MAMTVADTDVLIDFLSNRAPGADRIAQELERGQLATTAINRFELLAGVRTRRQEKAVHDLLAALLTLPLDQPAADEAAEIRRTLDLAGASIGMGDSLIAGVVRFHDAHLVTRNRRHFDRVRGLKLSLVASAP